MENRIVAILRPNWERLMLEMGIGWKEGLSNCYILLARPTKL